MLESVVVSRYLDGAKSVVDDIINSFGNWMFTKLVNLFFGGNYTDTLVMLRAFKKELLYTLPIETKIHPTFEYELAIRCAEQKKRVTEISADEPKRIGGVRKMHPLYNGTCILRLFIKELLFKKQSKV